MVSPPSLWFTKDEYLQFFQNKIAFFPSIYRRNVQLHEPEFTRVRQQWIRSRVFLPTNLQWVSMRSFSASVYGRCSILIHSDSLCRQRCTSRLRTRNVGWRGRVVDLQKWAENTAVASTASLKRTSTVNVLESKPSAPVPKTLHNICICFSSKMVFFIGWYSQMHSTCCSSCPQLLAVLTCGSSLETSWFTQRRTRVWWSGRTVEKGCSSSSSPRLWLRCGARRRKIAAWLMRSWAVPWGELHFSVNLPNISFK